MVFDDLHDERRIVVLAHLLNGKCVSAPPNPSCQPFARDDPSTIHLSNLLCSLLLVAHQNKSIPLQVFPLCCGSIGLYAITAYPGRELQSKLQRRLKHRKFLIECPDVFCMLNRLELFGVGTISELVSLHGIGSNLSTKDTACDSIVRHLVSGVCDDMNSELCLSVCSASHACLDRSKPIDLQSHILDGVLKTANRKIFPRILYVLNIPHSPTDSIKVFRSLLRKYCTGLRAHGQTIRIHCHELKSQRDYDAALATITRTWPQRISHSEKANMIHGFHSLTSSNALKSFTCASCAERVRCAKRSNIPIASINLDILRRPVPIVPEIGRNGPPMPFADGPLREIFIDSTGVSCDGNNMTCLALCPPCKSALSRNTLPRLSLANLNVIGPVPPELGDLTLVEEIIVA